MGSNDVVVENVSVQGIPLTRLVRRVDVMFRQICLFRSAVCGGVDVNGPSTARRRICTTTGGTHYCSFVVTLPSKFRAMINRNNTALSNNRGRHVSVTHYVLGSTPVVVLSRTATDMSASGRDCVRRTVSRLMGNGAVLMVTRHLGAVRGTSRVLIVSGNRVTRRNARRRLLGRPNVCRRFIGVQGGTTK